MPNFVNGHELSLQLAVALKNAKTVRLAVAFWGRGAADKLGLQDNSVVRTQVVCNLVSGGTNPNEIRTLLSRGVDVKQLDDLHAKLGVIDDLSFLGSSNMSTNGLGPRRLSIRVIRGPQRGDKQLCCAHFAGHGVSHVDCVPCVIDEQTLARRVTLAHYGRQLAFPPGVKLAKPGIAVAFRVIGAIFFPQQ